MIKEQIYSVKDVKAGNYLPPFTAGNDAVAIRSLSQIVNSGRGQMAEFPEDFDLYHVGEWTVETAEVVSVIPRHVIHVINLKRGAQNVSTPTNN